MMVAFSHRVLTHLSAVDVEFLFFYLNYLTLIFQGVEECKTLAY